jgi:hypothetical protein
LAVEVAELAHGGDGAVAVEGLDGEHGDVLVGGELEAGPAGAVGEADGADLGP